jgi:putative ABC transport system permease protein
MSASNVTYLSMQVRAAERDVRSMVVGIVTGGPGEPGQPGYLIAGRHITRSHYEAVADIAAGFKLHDRIQIRRNYYTVVGLTRRMVSSGGDPMIFIPLRDAQEAQFLKDNDAIVEQRRRTTSNPAYNRAAVPGLLDGIIASQSVNPYVNAVLVKIRPGYYADDVAASVRRWKRLQVFTRPQMEEILIGKLISTASRQIGMFLVILSVVTAAIVAFIIYTLTLGKIREIAVLKLIGTKNFTIAWMIMQESVGLGIIGFVTGKTAASFWAPIFPKYVLLEPMDAIIGFVAVVIICILASLFAIYAALSVDPAEAIGG